LSIFRFALLRITASILVELTVCSEAPPNCVFYPPTPRQILRVHTLHKVSPPKLYETCEALFRILLLDNIDNLLAMWIELIPVGQLQLRHRVTKVDQFFCDFKGQRFGRLQNQDIMWEELIEDFIVFYDCLCKSLLQFILLLLGDLKPALF
jgi:hypothetical protein